MLSSMVMESNAPGKYRTNRVGPPILEIIGLHEVRTVQGKVLSRGFDEILARTVWLRILLSAASLET